MVGDAPGGIKTPYTEYVHARPGGGFDVYNQQQMRSMPAMAGGGSVGSDDIAGIIRDGFDKMIQIFPQRIAEEIQKRL